MGKVGDVGDHLGTPLTKFLVHMFSYLEPDTGESEIGKYMGI
jgi:hypothetical protein